MVTSNVSLTGEFSPNFDLKYTISTYIKVFLMGKMAQIHQIFILKTPNCQSLMIISRR